MSFLEAIPIVGKLFSDTADIIKEVKQVAPAELQDAIRGIRKAYIVLPPKLQKEMLSEFSNLEYVFTSSAHSMKMDVIDKTPSIFEIYTSNKE